ncbi:MAG: winged helix-turn-helix domain-containing protein [archaeon]
MSPRRSSFKIAIDVLNVIGEGEDRPTRIMYASNLSWNSLQRTLDILVNKGYVDENQISERVRKYSITAKGHEVLGYYDRLESLVEVTTD